MAGAMALADQRAGRRHGFANPALHGRSGTTAYRDVVAPATPIALVRKDFVNGVGTPNSQQFLDALAFGAGR